MTEPSLSNLPADIFTESLLSSIPQEEHQEEEGAAAEHEQERQQPAAARAALLGELRALWRRGILLGVGRNIGRRLPRRRLQEPDGGSRQAAGR